MSYTTTSNNLMSNTTEDTLQSTTVDLSGTDVNTEVTTEVNTLVQRQVELEEEMRGLGISRYRAEANKARTRRDESTTRPGVLLMRQALAPLIEALDRWKDEAASGKAGRRHSAYVPLSLLPTDVACYLALKTALDGVSSMSKLPVATRVAHRIGVALADEVLFRAFEEAAPYRHKRLVKDYERAAVSPQRRRSRLKKAALKAEIATYQPWDVETRVRVGVCMLDLMIQVTGWFTMEVKREGWDKTKAWVKPTPELLQWIQDTHAVSELMAPAFLPMLVPPVDWSGPRGGGYLTKRATVAGGNVLIRTRSTSFLDEVQGVEMPTVYAGVNALQRTPWRIKEPVWQVVKSLWEAKSTLGGLPSVYDDTMPTPPDQPASAEAIAAYKLACAAVVEAAGRNSSRRIALAKCLWVAEKFSHEDRFYFPHFLDFRGRAYPRTLFLSPQGVDYAKAMLEFADGIEIGHTGACWLAIHGANTYGYDKADLQARIDWVQEHTKDILRCAEDPYQHTFWATADKPFQFLAFCLEWAGYQREGEAYVSHLPIAMDGSCNGLQNFSMALRDPVGGAAVNLVPSPRPQDIYQQVADKVLAKLRAIATDAGEDAMLAREWLGTGLVTRKLAKKPVMTLPYGATVYGARTYMASYLIEQRDAGKVLPWTDVFKPARFICDVIWEAIDETVVAARTAMTFLQQVAQVAAKDQLPLYWRTPSGFVVLQQYQRAVGKTLNTVVGGERLRLTVALEGQELDARRQSAGVAPNWVHSMDAAHMMRTLELAANEGIEDFAMVHDSYATHAANTQALATLLRAAFVETYAGDVLADFRQQIADQLPPELAAALPPAPPMGTLDPEAVMASEFFFA